MALSSGTRLGAYEIVSAIGAGGMGEVYRGRDTKLDRDVAIKVLPETFASDPERIARFQREAKALASLNHPHIGAIYGLEESSGIKAPVLELVEGPMLADRVRRADPLLRRPWTSRSRSPLGRRRRDQVAVNARSRLKLLLV